MESWQWSKQYVGLQEGEGKCPGCGGSLRFKSIGLDSDCCTWPECKRQFGHVEKLEQRGECGAQCGNVRVIVWGYCHKHYAERAGHKLDCDCLPPEVRSREQARRDLFKVELQKLGIDPKTWRPSGIKRERLVKDHLEFFSGELNKLVASALARSMQPPFTVINIDANWTETLRLVFDEGFNVIKSDWLAPVAYESASRFPIVARLTDAAGEGLEMTIEPPRVQ